MSRKFQTGVIYLSIVGFLLFHCSKAMDISTSILGESVKITIVENNRITLNLNKGKGEHHVLRLGEHIPLIGSPNWKTSPDQFKSTWENGVQLALTAQQDKHGVRTLRTTWTAPPNVLTLHQCIDLGQYNWYGGSEWYYQPWTIQSTPFSKVAFAPGFAGYSGVIAPYFLSSASVAYFAQPTNPLFVSLSTEVNNSLCLTVEFNEPYRNTNGRSLVLDLDTIWNDPPNMTALWLSSSLTHFGHPSVAPSQKVFHDPIWSTWAVYKTDINQTSVVEFAQGIHDRGFPVSQIEIDDKWETCYGDQIFDPAKFPDPASMVNQIKSLGYDITLWTHPFINTNCPSFEEAESNGYLVTVNGTTETGITSWWEGNEAGVIDITKQSAADWWRSRLTDLTSNVGITAFKFDAGEAGWLPHNAYLATAESLQPGSYTTLYTEFAKSFGGQVETRVGNFAQRQGGTFSRLLDRDSRWGLDNGLQSVITGTLYFGIVGYPFVLPDFIGGNAYGTWPDRELYIRWAELNAFLPVIQLSILPWSYDDELSNITLRMIQLRQSQPIDDAFNAAIAQALQDGTPIIRPLWWLDWTDATAQVIDSEFLVGSTYLVAPIVSQGATTRDIYIPKGTWTDMLHGGDVTGPIWLYNYAVALDEIAYFRNAAA